MFLQSPSSTIFPYATLFRAIQSSHVQDIIHSCISCVIICSYCGNDGILPCYKDVDFKYSLFPLDLSIRGLYLYVHNSSCSCVSVASFILCPVPSGSSL